MKNFLKSKLLQCLLVIISTFYVGCKKSDPAPQVTTVSKQFNLISKSNPNINGTVTFAKKDDVTTLVTIQLKGTTAGGTHPAHIHANTAAEGGSIILDLTNVDGATGKSETSINSLNTGIAISYNELLTFNGYINVHESATNLSTIIAEGDIGRNELTSTSKTYPLSAVSNPAISGTAKFTRRVSGETLVSISLSGTTAGVTSPAHIHLNSVAIGGGIAIDLTSVNGATGKSETSVKRLNSGTAITYEGLLSFNGYINVHESASNMATLIAQGNIGSNEGGTSSVNYTVVNAGASSYVFTGNGLTNVNNPSLTLQRGRTYIFTLNAPGHPFLIKTVQSAGTANAYNDGVTNNGVSSGVISFTVPTNAPNTLFYICEFHTSMAGTITIIN